MNKKIDSQDILFGGGTDKDRDESYTPFYGVAPIIKYIPKGVVVWCPFDTEESHFVKSIRANGNKVIVSHIDNGQDFFRYEPDEHWDMIVSNPPFSNKCHFFKRALEFGKPFALLMNTAWLFDAAPYKLFGENSLQLMTFNKRMLFTKPDGTIDNKITFMTAYFCYRFLPENEKLIVKKIEVPGSSMRSYTCSKWKDK